MTQEYRKELIKNKEKATAIRVSSYFDLILKNDPNGASQLAHIFSVENEELKFYQIPESELKRFWESIEKQALSFREYTKAEEWELHDFFWKTYMAN